MTTFHFAVEALTWSMKRLSCGLPRKVRFGSLILFLQAWETGVLRPVAGSTAPKAFRTFCGAVGARSGWPVLGLSQTWFAEALALLKERSSRKNTWRFLPQRKLR